MIAYPIPHNGYYNGTQIYQAGATTSFPGSIISIALNLIGLILFNIFRKNRKYPVSVLSLIAMHNVIFAAFLIARFSPESLQFFKTAKSCYLSISMATMYYYSHVALNTIVAVVLYVSVVKRIDVGYEIDKRYFWYSAAFYLIFMLSGTLGFMLTPSHNVSGYICLSSSSKFLIVPLGIMLCVQISLIIVTSLQIRKIIRSAKALSQPKDRRMHLLIARFLSTIIIQFFSVAAYFTIALSPAPQLYTTIIFCCLMINGCPSCDALVLIFLNRPLLKFLRRKLGHRVNISSTSLHKKSVELTRAPSVTSTTTV